MYETVAFLHSNWGRKLVFCVTVILWQEQVFYNSKASIKHRHMTFCASDITASSQTTIFSTFSCSYMLPTTTTTTTHTHTLNKHCVKRAWRHFLCFYDCGWQFNPILWEQPIATRDSCIMKSHTEETWQLCLPGILLLLLMMYSDCTVLLSHFSFVFLFMSSPYCHLLCVAVIIRLIVWYAPCLGDCLLWSGP